MPSKAVETLLKGGALSVEETEGFIEGMIKGSIDEPLMVAFLTALAMKGPSKEELLGAVRVFQRHAAPITPPPYPLMDTCGTGGKAYPTLNVSTLSAFVVASFGVKVAKHGNRSFRNALGSAQVLERLGVNVALEPERSLRLLEEVGVGFFLAPAYHPAMQAVKGLRAKLPFRTLFNLLGPLTNPLPLTYQVVGVYDSRYVHLIAECLRILGRKRACVVYGEDGQDELSLASPSVLAVLQEDGRIERLRVEPEDFGVSRFSKERLILQTQEEQLEAFQRVIEGNPSPWLELVALNAGLALFVCGLTGNIKGGYGLAKEALLTRSALEVFERFRKTARGDDPVPS